MVVGSNPAVPTNFKFLGRRKSLFFKVSVFKVSVFKVSYLSPDVVIAIWIQATPVKSRVLLTVLLTEATVY